MFAIELDKVCQIIALARAANTAPATIDAEDGSNLVDDDMQGMLGEDARQSNETLLRSLIDTLDGEERLELMALVLIGRETYTREEWGDALDAARGEMTANFTDQLLEIPLLADYLAGGLDAFGRSCDE